MEQVRANRGRFGFGSAPRIELIRKEKTGDCGTAALLMIAGYYQLVPPADLLAVAEASEPPDIFSLDRLMVIADGMGLAPRLVRLPAKGLRSIHVPALLQWTANEFVVLERIRGDHAIIHSPIRGTFRMPLQDIDAVFTGAALELRLVNRFGQRGSPNSLSLGRLWRGTLGAKSSFARILALSVVSQVFMLGSPYYLQIAVDFAVPATDHELLAKLALGFGLLVVINFVALLLRGMVLQMAGSRIGFDLASNVTHKLLRLPIPWFEQAETGDILSRLGSVEPIKEQMSEGTARVSLDGIFAVITLLILFDYSWVLAMIVVAAFTLYGAMRLLSFQFQKRAEMACILSQGKEQSLAVETVRGIATLRLSGSEIRRHGAWLERLIEDKRTHERLGLIRLWQFCTGTLILGLENIVTTWLAVSFVIDGTGMTIGMVFAFKAYRQHFVQSMTGLIDKSIGFRMLSLHLDRLSQIVASESDKSFTSKPRARRELKGRIELRDVSYTYPSSDCLAVEGVNFVVDPGEHVAITGPSGGGKSTLLKLMLGLIEPQSGEILVDGLRLEQFGYRNYHDQIAAVLQEDCLFAGTLAENIALFDDSADMARIMASAMAAAIHADIADMPQQYGTSVGDMGSALSGGQKQRILLARALYRRPCVLFMDEGTSHLDIACERAVNDGIRKLGVTRIIVAHREETIMAADRRLVISNGRIATG